jgi:hypothetical protein
MKQGIKTEYKIMFNLTKGHIQTIILPTIKTNNKPTKKEIEDQTIQHQKKLGNNNRMVTLRVITNKIIRKTNTLKKNQIITVNIRTQKTKQGILKKNQEIKQTRTNLEKIERQKHNRQRKKDLSHEQKKHPAKTNNRKKDKKKRSPEKEKKYPTKKKGKSNIKHN